MSSDSFEAPSIEELAPLFPQYEIEELVAVYGLVIAYKAVQTSLERDVTIKLIPSCLGDEVQHARFQREAKALARLSHENLLKVMDFGEIEGMSYSITEYVDGNSLRVATAGEPIDVSQCAELLSQLALGIESAHESEVIHRSLSPDSILIDQSLNVKVVDFGSDADDKTHTAFCAPELAAEWGTCTTQSDIYSIGAVAYYLLTAEEPKPNQVSDLERCDIRFRPMLESCLSPSTQDRYGEVGELVKELNNILKLVQQNPKPIFSAKEMIAETCRVSVKPKLASSMAAAPAATRSSEPAPVSNAAPASSASPFTVKKSSNAAPIIVTLIFLLVIGTVVGVLISQQVAANKGDDTLGTEKKKDMSLQSLVIENASFESGSTATGKIKGWTGTRISAQYAFELSQKPGMNGNSCAMIRNGKLIAESNEHVEQGYRYTLEFSLAKGEARELVAGQDYKVNISIGDIPLSRFDLKEQLQDADSGGSLERFRLTFESEFKSNDYKRAPVGVRIVASYCTIYIDDVTLTKQGL